MDELAEHGWSAFQIPAGKGKPLCFCPEHQLEMREQMEKKLTKLSEEVKQEAMQSEARHSSQA